MEVTGSAWIYTDNDEFFNGNKFEQDPLYTFQHTSFIPFARGSGRERVPAMAMVGNLP
jgi:hypothetical protein